MTLATILPTPRTVFFDINEIPLVGGFVYTYLPNTTTPNTTWQDSAGVTANSNPIILDGNGSCLLYGSGEYTLSVYDSSDNLIYTGLTQDVAGLLLNGNNTFTGNNTFSGTTIFTGTINLPDNFVTNANLAYMMANTVKVNATNGLASPTDLGLSLNTLLGRGSSGNIAPITLGTGLSMATDVLNGYAGLTLAYQVFTTTRTYTPTAGMAYCIVEVLGGGGGGGADDGSSTYFGSGGGSGAYARSWLSAATVGASQSVTIGAGGAGSSGLGSGATGGTTSFGALISCTGGVGGVDSSGAIVLGGIGGTPTSGNFGVYGQSGAPNNPNATSGAGGNSIYGAGGAPVITNTYGNPGLSYGAGGSGCGEGYSGGNGVHGLIIVTEFCS